MGHFRALKVDCAEVFPHGVVTIGRWHRWMTSTVYQGQPGAGGGQEPVCRCGRSRCSTFDQDAREKTFRSRSRDSGCSPCRRMRWLVFRCGGGAGGADGHPVHQRRQSTQGRYSLRCTVSLRLAPLGRLRQAALIVTRSERARSGPQWWPGFGGGPWVRI